MDGRFSRRNPTKEVLKWQLANKTAKPLASRVENPNVALRPWTLNVSVKSPGKVAGLRTRAETPMSSPLKKRARRAAKAVRQAASTAEGTVAPSKKDASSVLFQDED